LYSRLLQLLTGYSPLTLPLPLYSIFRLESLPCLCLPREIASGLEHSPKHKNARQKVCCYLRRQAIFSQRIPFPTERCL
jgi:hypothetical protein